MVFDYNPQYLQFIKDITDTNSDFFHGEEDRIRFISYLTKSKAFSIQKNICSAISNSKSIESYYLPFPSIILFPEDFYVLGNKVIAIHCIETYFKENDPVPFYIDEFSGQQTKNLKKNIAVTFDIDKGDYTLTGSFCYPTNIEDIFSNYKNAFNLSIEEKEQMKNFIFGLINFLNNPEVKFIEHKLNLNRNQKRIKKGKPPFPQRVTINVNGKLKVYLDDYEREFKNNPFSYRFWVRGHFRHLTSDSWKNKKGQTIWVVPYIKGKGILINKNYEVKA